MSKRILMVEDTEDNRQIVRDLLAATEYELIEAADGAAGVAAAVSERPDLILMDIQLPVIDGYEAARRIKADPTLRQIPIIASHLLRIVGRRGESPRCGVRRLHCQALQPAPTANNDPRIPCLREAAPCTIHLAFSPSTTRRKISKSCACASRRAATKWQLLRTAKRACAGAQPRA